MMIDLVRGKTTAAQQLIDMFLAMIRQELGSDVLNALGDAIVAGGADASAKCAVLAWHTSGSFHQNRGRELLFFLIQLRWQANSLLIV